MRLSATHEESDHANARSDGNFGFRPEDEEDEDRGSGDDRGKPVMTVAAAMTAASPATIASAAR